MKDNRGVTLIELVVAIAILSAILLSIYSFYIVGVKGFARESTTVSNQLSIRRASNDIGREIRRSIKIELQLQDGSDVYNVLRLTSISDTNDEVLTEYIHDSNNKTIKKVKKDIDGNIIYSNEGWAGRVKDFTITINPTATIGDTPITIYDRDRASEENLVDQIIVTIESIENVDMSSSGGQTDKLENVITIRK